MIQHDKIARVAPGTAYTTGANVLSSDITIVTCKVVNISVSVSTAAKLQLYVNSTALAFNADTNLTADTLYTFSFIASNSDVINFRFSGNCTIRYFVVSNGNC